MSLTLLTLASITTITVSTKAFAKNTLTAAINSIKYSLKNIGFYNNLAKQHITSLEGAISLPEKLYYHVGTREYQLGAITPDDQSLPTLKATVSPNKSILTFPGGFKVQAKWQKPTYGFFSSKAGYFYDFKFLDTPAFKAPTKVKLKELPEINIGNMTDKQLEFSNSYQLEQEQKMLSEIHSNLRDALTYLFENFSYEKTISIEDLVFINKTLGAHSYIKLPSSDSEISKNQYINHKSQYANYTGFVRGSKDDPILAKSYLRGDSQETVLLEFPPSNKSIMVELEALVKKINAINNDDTTLFEVATIYKDFLSLHPFYDGNGRIGRALLDFSLLKAGFPPLDKHSANTAKIHWMSTEEVTAALSKNFSY